METLGLIACACLVWVASFVLLPHDGEARQTQAQRWLHHAARLSYGAIGMLASGGVVSWLMGFESVRALSDAVMVAITRRGVRGFSQRQACAVLVVGTLIAMFGCSLLSRSLVGIVVVSVACAVGLPTWDSARRRRQQQEIASEMPGVFRSLAMAMGAGETLSQAIEYVGTHEEGPAGGSFMRTSLRLRCGASVEEALATLASELDAPGIGLLSTALLISQRTGSPLQGLFEYSASLVERSREFERLLAVKTAQVRLSVRIVCLLPILMLLGLSMLSPDFRQGLMTAPGTVSVVIAAMMDATALALIRRIMRGTL